MRLLCIILSLPHGRAVKSIKEVWESSHFSFTLVQLHPLTPEVFLTGAVHLPPPRPLCCPFSTASPQAFRVLWESRAGLKHESALCLPVLCVQSGHKEMKENKTPNNTTTCKCTANWLPWKISWEPWALDSKLSSGCLVSEGDTLLSHTPTPQALKFSSPDFTQGRRKGTRSTLSCSHATF